MESAAEGAPMQPSSIPQTEFAVHVAPSPGEGSTVTIFGELDLVTVDRVSVALNAAIAADGPVVVDMRACGFVDSRGIGCLVQAALKIKEGDRVLVLRGIQPRVERILEVAGISNSELVVIEPREQRV
jgi:anti-anti-sigma factor